MSPKCLPFEARKQVIRENILSLTYEELAKQCYCTKRTIVRTVNKWREDGGFEQFLLDEFFRSYPNMKEKFPDKAFDRLCYLLGKTMTRKAEIQERLDVTTRQFVIHMWKPDEPTE